MSQKYLLNGFLVLFIMLITEQLTFAFLMDHRDSSVGFQWPLTVFFVSAKTSESILWEQLLLMRELPFYPCGLERDKHWRTGSLEDVLEAEKVCIHSPPAIGDAEVTQEPTRVDFLLFPVYALYFLTPLAFLPWIPPLEHPLPPVSMPPWSQP